MNQQKKIRKIILLSVLFGSAYSFASAQTNNTIETLQVPAKNQFCTINEKGITILPSGRYITPAGSLIRITNDPFGMAISPDGEKAVTLHNGVFTIIDLKSLQVIRVPGYNNKLNSPLAHQPLNASPFTGAVKDSAITTALPKGSFLG